MKKEVAIDILENIKKSLSEENWKEETLKNIVIYKKYLENSDD